MPAVGSFGLRVLSPTVLELTLITTKEPDPARVNTWDFIDASGQWKGPNVSQFKVLAGGQEVTVAQAGFKRRPIYAPLKTRDLRIGNWLYLVLASPVAEQQTVEVTNPDGQLWPASMTFSASMAPLRWSPAVHVNQVGYLPAYPKKAMVGFYLGSLGELSVPAQQGFKVINSSGAAVFQSSLTRRQDVGYTYSPAPYQQVWEADFSPLNIPGEYRLLVPGLGTSFPFRIDEGTAAAFARTFALGIFHQRCGAKEELPFTRFVHDVCHVAPAQVPTMSYSAVNAELANMTSDFASSQTAPRMKDVNSSLYPFVDLASRDVSGGHHDAGDYSKYTINSAGFIHYLTFAADAFPGVVSLDNLGLPESGDGKSDVLQEAKWEADFLAKMQDRDGGFYFLVYPKDREYEDNVLPDKGDPQVVFPKTTSVTAAAVAALAEIGSSPSFRKQFPAEAAACVQKAQLGWTFLQTAISKYGKAGAYQKITHYGNEFGHDDELAWAAAALFAATGEQSYHQQLKAWFDPANPNTQRWSWWRLFEGYGCAVRTYAFAARSGRLPASALDSSYLAKCEAEIQAAASDQLRFARENAYGTSFPDLNKAYRSAGWYFSSERAFDLTVAYQISPRAEYLEAVLGNLNYEGGCNPLNVTYLTGIGAQRQREVVHQFAQNDRRVLPPSGLPLGNVQAGFQYLDRYKGELGSVTYPSDGADRAPYPFYDRWSDSFNTTTEFVITDQARSLASLAFWMAQSSLKNQPWRAASGQIAGLPAQSPAKEKLTATFLVPGIDLAGARIVWEGREQEPLVGNPVSFAPTSAGEQWLEVEAQLPDGRRIVASTNFLATTALDTPPNAFQSAPLSVTPDILALYHLDAVPSDSARRAENLALTGNAEFDTSNLGWMAKRQGAALHVRDLGDRATALVPNILATDGRTSGVILEAMIYIESFVAYNRDLVKILSLYDTWNAFLELGEDKYAGPYIRGGTQLELIGAPLTQVLTPKQWHHLSLEINRTGYSIRIDGATVKSAPSSELLNWGPGSSAKVEIGNFNGWVDELVVRTTQSAVAENTPPSVSLTSPLNDAAFVAPTTIRMSAAASDADGTVSKVEFYQGGTKLGEATAAPYTFTWSGVGAGTYSITAKATDNKGASTTSAPVSIKVTSTQPAVETPTISPNGGSALSSATVALACPTPGVLLRYTTDGSDPTQNSTVYAGGFVITNSCTVKAKAFASPSSESAVAAASFQVTTVTASGARVTFVQADLVTQGNWKGVYGTEGFSVFGDSSKPAAFVRPAPAGKVEYTWAESTSDIRALQKAASNDRVASCWYSPTSFTLNLSLTDGRTHRFALYFMDWDRLGRAEKVEILDPVSNAVLDSRTVSNFAGGMYLAWDLKGKINLRISRVAGPNAVVMGWFFDPRTLQSNDLPAAALLTLQTIPSSSRAEGWDLRLSGEVGQTYVVESSEDLIAWSPIHTNTLVEGDSEFSDLLRKGGARLFFRARSVAGPWLP